MTDGLAERYAQLYECALVEIARNLERLVRDHLAGMPRIDRVTARAKGPARFLAKAAELTDEGKRKYGEPLLQIQDQIGARIVVFYRSDVEAVGTEIEAFFAPIERRDLIPESEWTFGYFGRHWVLALPRDVVPVDVDPQDVPGFFELQVKTLFQHAWSEASHDLAYKPPEELSSDQQRRFAYTSAQAWGADRIFEELRNELLARDEDR